jgi:hypothetical protein
MSTDPETERLRDAVIERARPVWANLKDRMFRLPQEDALGIALAGLDEHVAKAANAPRCEPPLEHRDWQYHWLDSERASHPCMSEWLAGGWYSANEVGQISPEDMAARGWSWHSVARPDMGAEGEVTQRITDEDIVDLWDSIDEATPHWLRGHIQKFARILLAKHSAALSDKDLDALWEIAKTTDRVVFPTEARTRLNLHRRK